jgi:hypothetical protein
MCGIMCGIICGIMPIMGIPMPIEPIELGIICGIMPWPGIVPIGLCIMFMGMGMFIGIAVVMVFSSLSAFAPLLVCPARDRNAFHAHHGILIQASGCISTTAEGTSKTMDAPPVSWPGRFRPAR